MIYLPIFVVSGQRGLLYVVSLPIFIARYLLLNNYEHLYVDDFPQGVLILMELDIA